MIGEILVVDPAQSPVPDTVTQLFDPLQTKFTTFPNITSLCIYLSTYASYTFTKGPAGLERTPNVNEAELNHFVGLLINTDKHSDGSALDRLPFAQQQKLLSYRFHHLNLVVECLSLSDAQVGAKLGEHFVPTLHKIHNLIRTRLLRVQTWVGLTDYDKIPQLNTMPTMLQTTVDIPTGMEYITLLSWDIRYIELLKIPHDDAYYKKKIADWEFHAFELTNDELLYCGYLMILHVLKDYKADFQTPEFHNRVLLFFFYVRDYYRQGNPFHNFRHAIDVMQATNYFLETIVESAYEFQFGTHERLALLLAAVGHDIGHPGTTNAFLASYKTPIAKIFNNESTLEKYHLAQYLNIMKCFFVKDDRCVEIARWSILATDMAQHDTYVGEMDRIADYKERPEKLKLMCAIILKSADISNVCRPIGEGVKWGLSLGNEFAEIAQLESVLKGEGSVEQSPVPQVSLAKITPHEAVQMEPKLGASQMFFINRFALDFFTKVVQIIPPLSCLSRELHKNIDFWQVTGRTGN
ncbi:hypothetical protein KL918_004493 [Ogataea parapolymorpha]|uniref:Phosphodiesterase n=1 Tax=Ogataea parapolymorpha (strain ATCC 26012 / BCRC 20466 / JCM 22074 / NRRL Y-7560 / DL-1) TaxID=871575 RepID=W1QFL0_OGAPD|nr:hypothetical protein HPODL_00287 [Ogataea parapolymorpha DL-1]ESX00873.1 hypothetical protein HPODL_00287 [Ogataea parapolymorpha DL-1]KAG7865612.1 hypothetical protein KL918_004493 [Ogataea parapolymorpha]KAG7873515.1 hypothetical protein KL916_002119 [Ogataea parapolymorpha]